MASARAKWPPESWGAFVDAVFDADPKRVPEVGSPRRVLLDGLADVCKDLSEAAGLPAGRVLWDPLSLVVRVLYPDATDKAGEPLLMTPLEELDGVAALRELAVAAHSTEPQMIELYRKAEAFADSVALPALFLDGEGESKMDGVIAGKPTASVPGDPVSVTAPLRGGDRLADLAARVVCLAEMLSLPQVVPCEDGVPGQDPDAVVMVQAAITDLLSILAARAVRHNKTLLADAFVEILPFIKGIMDGEALGRLRGVLDETQDFADEVAAESLVEDWDWGSGP